MNVNQYKLAHLEIIKAMTPIRTHYKLSGKVFKDGEIQHGYVSCDGQYQCVRDLKLPLIGRRRSWRNLWRKQPFKSIVHDLIPVQPMGAPTGLVFTFDPIYNAPKDGPESYGGLGHDFLHGFYIHDKDGTKVYLRRDPERYADIAEAFQTREQ